VNDAPATSSTLGGILTEDVERARYERGADMLARVDGEGGQRVVESLADIAPALAHHVVAYGFGDVYARRGLTPPQRQLVTLGMLTALGGCEPQLDVHINASLNVGLTPTQIVETITHAAVYCGFPKALNAIFVAKRVFGERDLLPVATGQ
jgi:4-carboxymuconolactone decarboxylase